MPTALVDLYGSCDEGRRQPLESQLEAVLLRILNIFKNAYIIVDSLDECTEKSDLFKWISFVASSTPEKLHLMVTSRPEPDVKRGLSFLSSQQRLDINNQSNASDIEAYIDAELVNMHKWNQPGEKELIKDALLRGSDGM